MTAEIKFYPVDNGDSIMMSIDQARILIDVNYRKDEDVFDVKKAIGEDCIGGTLDYFILTHPHDDHTRGFDEIFHCGAPSKKPKNKILVQKIICTEYATSLADPTEVTSSLINEIKRRKKLSKEEKDKSGNQLQICGEGDQFRVHHLMKATVLSPSEKELKNARDEDGNGNGTAINNSSLVISWEYNGLHKVLLGADAEHDVWNRLGNKYSSEQLKWQLCEACHHCSRATFASKDSDDNYADDDDAINALSHKVGDGFVVSSSKEIKRNNDNPPSYIARNKWFSILRKNGKDKPEKRFLCTADNSFDKDGKPEPVCFELTKEHGVGKLGKSSSKNAAGLVAGTGLDRTTKYGDNLD